MGVVVSTAMCSGSLPLTPTLIPAGRTMPGPVVKPAEDAMPLRIAVIFAASNPSGGVPPPARPAPSAPDPESHAPASASSASIGPMSNSGPVASFSSALSALDRRMRGASSWSAAGWAVPLPVGSS